MRYFDTHCGKLQTWSDEISNDTGPKPRLWRIKTILRYTLELPNSANINDVPEIPSCYLKS